MSPRSLRAVVFWDFDGTLAVRRGRWSGALVEALRTIEPRSTVTDDQLRPFLGTGFPWHQPDVVVDPPTAAEWWRRLQPTLLRAYASAGVGPRAAAAAAGAVPAVYYDVAAWTLAPDTHSALDQTRRAGLGNVILSNHGPGLPHLLGELGLSPLFDHTVTSATVGAEKPHRMIFDHAVASSGADIASSFMIGDNPDADVAGARAIGLHAVLVRPFHPSGPGLSAAVASVLHHRRGAGAMSDPRT